MQIIDTVPFFMENYQPSVAFLKSYYQEYPEIFKEYFAYHCKDTDERHQQSLAKYPEYFSLVEQVHQNIVPVMEEITAEYFKRYGISFPIDVNLIVGGFGSNAYTYRQIIPNITFSLERLSPNPDHLRTIVAHEFGHATHNIMSNQAGVDWKNVKWTSPLTWLNQEGAAIHFSRQTAENLHPSLYFSFNDEGHDWLDFAIQNAKGIKKAFAKDYETLPPEQLFREWFSIYGGKRFGHSRLAYFIGDLFFQSQIKHLGEMEAVMAWGNQEFEKLTEHWLLQE